MIDDTFTLKRDASAENAAVQGIVSLFTDKWDETSKKSSREITALVLMQIKDACIVVPKGEDTDESVMLKHVNNYLDKTIEQLQSNKPLQMVISGSTLVDIIKNLENIRSAALGEEFENDIKNRLAFFITKTQSKVEQMQAAYQKEKSSILGKSILYGLLFAVAMELFTCFGIGTDFSIAVILFGWVIGAIVSYSVLYTRLNNR